MLLGPLLLRPRHLDSRTHKLLLRATVKVASKKSQAVERDAVPGFRSAAARLSDDAEEELTGSWDVSSTACCR